MRHLAWHKYRAWRIVSYSPHGISVSGSRARDIHPQSTSVKMENNVNLVVHVNFAPTEREIERERERETERERKRARERERRRERK